MFVFRYATYLFFSRKVFIFKRSFFVPGGPPLKSFYSIRKNTSNALYRAFCNVEKRESFLIAAHIALPHRFPRPRLPTPRRRRHSARQRQSQIILLCRRTQLRPRCR